MNPEVPPEPKLPNTPPRSTDEAWSFETPKV